MPLQPIRITTSLIAIVTVCCLFSCEKSIEKSDNQAKELRPIRAVNDPDLEKGTQTIAIAGVTLIDGNGGEAVSNSVVVVKDHIIESVGIEGSISIPEGAKIIDGKGLTLMPGLIDAHYHGDNPKMSGSFLSHGVTSVRDPGAWIEAYEDVVNAKHMVPRLFLTGPHLDMFPPAYPANSAMVRDSTEARNHVLTFYEQGASAIKVYFRVTPDLIKVICETADELGIPTTAHLEIAYARDAIEAGIDGIEHITSFGIDLVPRQRAEAYRQSVLADNSARRNGRYEMWSEIDLNHPRTTSMIDLIVQNQTVLSPTLAIFEYQLDDEHTDTTKQEGFKTMMAFVGKAKKAGAPVVVGSHTWVPYADYGWAYQREMELLAASGLTNAEVIQAATMENARFLRIEDRLGSIEAGKQADLVLVNGNPLEDIKAMYNIEKVMLNGVWVPNFDEE
ncbi:MAG: amidohydrolase family protein [Cyclobacteriaceae bacterium]